MANKKFIVFAECDGSETIRSAIGVYDICQWNEMIGAIYDYIDESLRERGCHLMPEDYTISRIIDYGPDGSYYVFYKYRDHNRDVWEAEYIWALPIEEKQ